MTIVGTAGWRLESGHLRWEIFYLLLAVTFLAFGTPELGAVGRHAKRPRPQSLDNCENLANFRLGRHPVVDTPANAELTINALRRAIRLVGEWDQHELDGFDAPVHCKVHIRKRGCPEP